jgi:peptidoglycan hydrolase-like protein with peptidoglycan-binding domain
MSSASILKDKMSAVVIGTRVVGSLNGSVGLGGFNQAEDVGVVQHILKNKGYYGRSRIDKVCGPFTIQAIKEFQARYVMQNPDGLILPGKKAWQKLISPNLRFSRVGRQASATATRLAPAVPVLAAYKLSEKGHWFIFHIEASNGQGVTRSLHWPEGASGVTIGQGTI